jgi:hypothetical protein
MSQQANQPPNGSNTGGFVEGNCEGEVTLRNAISLIAICAAVILLQPCSTLAAHDMTCHPPTLNPGRGFAFIANNAGGPGEELNLIVPGFGGATSTSCSGASGDSLPVVLPPDSFSAVEHVRGAGQAGRYWFFGPVSRAFFDAHIGLSAELPNFTMLDGTPLLTQYRETELAFVLNLARTFTPGEGLSVSSGAIAGWQGAMLREMPASFTLDELLAADPSRFPAYTGTAEVADIARIEVVQLVPEPTSWLLLIGGAMAIAGRHRTSRRA